MSWFYQTLAVFISHPSLAILISALFGVLFYVSGGKLIAATTAAWLFYGIYEYLMHFRVLCTGECNIRVDLLLLYPALALLSIIAVVSFCRSRPFSETD
jgi:hypothetical protein